MIFLLMKLYSLFLFDTKKCIIDVDVVLIRASKKKGKKKKKKSDQSTGRKMDKFPKY